MRSGFLYVSLALVSLAAGAGLWTTGQLQQRLVGAQREILTMRYGAPMEAFQELEDATAYGRRLPWVAQMRAAIGEQRAQSQYWQRDYVSMALARDAGGAVIEEDPTMLLFAANAAYRRIKLDGTDRDVVARLQDVGGQYAEVLKRNPDLVDAAYNYEFVALAREALGRNSGGQSRASRPAPQVPVPTVHGRPGAPPKDADMGDFKVIIPQRQDERQQRPESGAGGAKPRKG